MRLGKLSNEQLQRLILDKFEANRPEVVLHPDVGVDCTAVDLGGELCVLSTDPITGAANNIGALAVHICCNDAAACGAVPVGILTTLLLPPEADEALVDRIASEVADAARLAGVDVLGGHTEVTDAVTRPVISATVVAKAARESLISSARMEPGDDLVMTKWAGLEGTSIIAADCEERAREVLTPEEWGRACALKDCLSVTRDAAIAMEHGAKAMHDITEGGVLGAAWEMAEASRCGLRLSLERVPLLDVTRKLCGHFGLNPYRLIASGAMLIACQDGPAMARALRAGGIEAAVIGRAVETGVFCERGEVLPPEADELLKLF